MKIRTLAMALLLGPVVGVAAESDKVRHEVNAATGIESWVLKAEEFSLELVQRLPDQTRAFFQGRGFDTVAANEIALGCVFQTVIKNDATESAAPVVALDLTDWRIDAGQGQRPLKLEQDWQKDWERRGVNQAARIAFHWALYPTRQEFHPGDYNWGMTTYGMPPGSTFDLHVVWHRGDEPRQHTIKGVRCARDGQR